MDPPVEPIPCLVTSSGQHRSPGPAAYLTRRDPIADVPKITLHGRTSIPADHIDAPYRVLPTSIGSGRKFTLKGRTEESIEGFPAGTYIPPPIGSSARSATFHQRLEGVKGDEVPGPGHYQVMQPPGKSARKATLHGVTDRSPPVLAGSPGPAYMVGIPASASGMPKWSIGRRWESGRDEGTPGPGAYEDRQRFQPALNGATFHGRVEVPEHARSPGPAAYDIQKSIIAQTPRIPMHGRCGTQGEVNQAPYRDVRKPLGGLKYSMRSRHNQEGETTPSPGYIPPPIGHDARKSQIAPRLERGHDEEVPGPGKYDPLKPLGKGAPTATFHGVSDRGPKSLGDRSPGPAEYLTWGEPGQRSPRYTLKGAKFEPEPDASPPYRDLGSTLAKPQITLHGRAPLDPSYG
jgi:hypothetical protein